jgi:hypothetical protein
VAHPGIAVDGSDSPIKIMVPDGHRNQAAAIPQYTRIEDGADLTKQVLALEKAQSLADFTFINSKPFRQSQIGPGDNGKRTLYTIKQYPVCGIQVIDSCEMECQQPLGPAQRRILTGQSISLQPLDYKQTERRKA